MRRTSFFFALIYSIQLWATKAPNIIFILTDDHGWTHLSHFADPNFKESKSDYYETPNMDKLAASGMQFTNAYAPNPICAPTRNSILFGQNAARHIYSNDVDWYKKTNEWLTIPRVIKKANPEYKTAHFGKWHIAMEPIEAGYDEHDGMSTNGGGENFKEDFINAKDYTAEATEFLKEHKMPNPASVKIAGKPTMYWNDKNPKNIYGLTRKAKNFMERSIGEGRPFYVQISHYATHLSFSSKKKTFEYFQNKTKGDRHKSPEFAAMLKDLDDGIGQIMDFVKEAGIADNTYIFLMGDNGGRLSLNQIASIDENKELVEAHYSDEKDRNSPLRDGKHSFYEGGLRVPFFVSGPGINPNSISNTSVTGLDLLPSFAELAGFEGDFPKEIDGGSLIPIMKNEDVIHVKRSKEALFFHQSSHRPPRSAVILHDYKLLKYWETDKKYQGSPKVELYNIKDDLGETKELSKSIPRKTAELHQLLEDFVIETNTCVTRRPEVRSAVYRKLEEVQNSTQDSLPSMQLKDLDIYLVIGQSNMAGRAPIQEDQKGPIPGAYVFADHENVPWVKASNPLNRYSTIRKKMSMQRLSPAYSFAQKMTSSNPEREIGLVINARGGTGVVQWLPGAKLYEEAISQTKKALKYGRLKGVIWHQGESDSDSLRTGMYLARIEVLVNALREEFEDPQLPFIAGQVFEKDNTIAFNHMLSKLPNFIKSTALVSSDNTNVFDGVHFDSKSIIVLGERYAEAMLDLQSRQR